MFRIPKRGSLPNCPRIQAYKKAKETMRYFKAATLIATLTLMLVAATVPAARAQTTIGTITQVQGAANIQRGAQNIAVVANLPVEVHDKIVTQPGASLTIGLVDNSALQIGENATVMIDESVLVNGFGAPSKVGLLNGKLHSLIVGAMRGRTMTFEVHTPNAVAAVRGTEFDTEYTDTPHDNDKGKYKDCRQFTYVDVQDGIVNVVNPQNTAAGSEDVHAGHHTVVACGDLFLDEGPAGLGALGYGAIGLGIAGGVVGGLAAGGVFDGGGTHSAHK
jgi:FecR protein